MPCFEMPIANNQPLCGCVVANMSTQGSDSLRQYTALIDTGATHCAISNKVVQELGLVCNRTQSTMGVHGSKETEMYKVRLGLFTTFQDAATAQEESAKHRMVVKIAEGISVSGFDMGHHVFDVIIGMEYLNVCTLVVSHGKFTLCY